MDLKDMIGSTLASIGLLTCLLLLGAAAVATFKNHSIIRSENLANRNRRKQARLFTTYTEWLKANPGSTLTFDQWKEANDR